MFDPNKAFCACDDGKLFGAVWIAEAACFQVFQLIVGIDESLRHFDHVFYIETGDGID